MKGTIGCLVKILIVVLVYFGLVYLGVIDYIQEKFFSPSREQIIEKSKQIVDLSDVDEEYKLDRNLDVGGNRIVVAEHKTTKQKFVVAKLKNNEKEQQENN